MYEISGWAQCVTGLCQRIQRADCP